MKRLVTILFLFVALLSGATNYYVSNTGSDAANGTTTGTAWETISKVNGETFSAGDSILFKRGGEWRGESLVVQWSGTEANPIVIGAYGTGDKPIFNGSEIITDWTNRGSATQQIDWSKTLDVDYNNTLYQNFRTRIASSELATTGDSIRIKIKAHGTNNIALSGASVGESASGDDFDSTPTRITFDGGSNTTTVTTGVDKYSDWVLYSADPSNDILIHCYLNSAATDYVYVATGGVSYRSTSAVDNTMTTTVDYGTSTASVRVVSEYEVKTSGSNIWATPHANIDEDIAERTTVLIDDEIFYPVDSLNQLLGDNQYYAVQTFSDSVYVYSETDPSTRTAELSTRNTGINISVLVAPYQSYKYININNIDFRQYGYGGIFVRGTVGDTVSSYATVDNCDFFLNRTTAVYFRYSGNNTAQNCTVSYAGNGLYSSRVGARPNKFINNTITNIRSYTAASGFTDGHAIGIYESKGALAEHNYIVVPYDGGGGIGIDQSDVTVRYNEIHSNHYPCIWPYATAAGDTLHIHNNILYAEADNGESGNWFNSTTIGVGGKINVYNNTMINDGTAMGIGYGMRLWSNADQIEFKNNIFYNDASITSFINFVNDGSTGEPVSDNNLWYNVGSTNYVWNYTTLSAWQTASSQDLNSEEGNPLFVTDFTDLQLQVGSPAINNGVDVGLTEDILGNPIVGIPDIGAYEYTVPRDFRYIRDKVTGKYLKMNGKFIGVYVD